MRLYLSYENRVIPNYFMVRASQFFDIDQNGDGQNDGIWCQSALNESMIGVWYLPNGSPVPTQRRPTPLESYNTNVTGQVGLLRRGGLASVEGLYSCIIPNVEGVNQTLYVAAYRVATFSKISKLYLLAIHIEFSNKQEVIASHERNSVSVFIKRNVQCTI